MKRLSIILKASVVACIVVGFAACGTSPASLAKESCECLKKMMTDQEAFAKCSDALEKKSKKYENDAKFQEAFLAEMEKCQ